MTRLERAQFPPFAEGEAEAKAKEIAESTGFPYQNVLAKLHETRREEVWMNDIYQVNVRRFPKYSPCITDISRDQKDMFPCAHCGKVISFSAGEVFRNGPSYTCADHAEMGIVHLSIKRLDKQPVTDWRHKQAIKNQLVGEECEGVELYPAESRLVDTSNQFHLWCVADNDFRFGFGWHEGRTVSYESAGGAIQRKEHE